MKVCVISSRYYNDTTKNGKKMNGYFVKGISFGGQDGKQKDLFDKFISAQTVGEEIKEGQVLDIYFNDKGFVDICDVEPNLKCELKVENGNK